MIYLASSWRNEHYGSALLDLRECGFNVYDFKEVEFHWRDVAADLGVAPISTNGNPPELLVNAAQMRQFLADKRAHAHYWLDRDALDACTSLVLVLPCGRSAHTEFGMVSQDRRAVVYQPPGVWVEPELLYGQADLYTDSFTQMVSFLRAQGEEWNWSGRAVAN